MRILIIILFAILSGCSNQNQSPHHDFEENPSADASKSTSNLSLMNTDLINEGLIAYFPFDGSASNMSGHKQSTTVSGATLSADRRISNRRAYRFDGIDDYIVCKNSATPHPKFITIAT